MNDKSPPANDPADRTTLRERRQRVLDEIAADAAASHDINDAIERKVAPAGAAIQTAQDMVAKTVATTGVVRARAAIQTPTIKMPMPNMIQPHPISALDAFDEFEHQREKTEEAIAKAAAAARARARRSGQAVA